MSTTSSIGVIGQQGQQDTTTNRYNDLGMKEFLQMMIAELQNQDPMEPMTNQEILQQISQIREIESNTRLTDSLESLQLGQAMSTAGSLIGKTVTGLPTGETEWIRGAVESVSVINGEVQLHVNSKAITLKNVAVIEGDAANAEDGTDTTDTTGTTDGTDETSTQ